MKKKTASQKVDDKVDDKVPIRDKLAHQINEAAEISGCGRNLIYEEINAGHLVARKLRGRTVILHTDLQAWLASLPRMGATAANPEAAGAEA